MTVINIEELETKQLFAKASGELLSQVKCLSAAFSLKGLIVHHETLLPGRKASSEHFHTKKEELIFILEGYPLIRLDGQSIRLRPGDVFGFPADLRVAHAIVNESNSPASFLSVGSAPVDDEVIYA